MSAPLVRTAPLSAEKFAPYGDVLEPGTKPDKLINQGHCKRFHDRAVLDFTDGKAGISIFESDCFTLPYRLEMVERHPLGSQAFLPLSRDPYLVVVCADKNGTPAMPQAFLAAPGQGINLHRNIWHGVLCPLSGPGIFAVVDRIGEGSNLEEFWFETPYRVQTEHQ